MDNFEGKVAVITGAASGFGLAVAREAAALGMKLVLADVEVDKLEAVSAEFSKVTDTIAVPTDVSKLEDIEALAVKTLEAFGGVHFLFNNAGVGGAGGSMWETTIKDWEWTINVNVWSIIYGIKTFVPIMLAQDEPSHIVNTASIAGLISGPSMGAYRMSKHSVVTMSETLYHELGQQNAPIGVSVLCPAWVKTGIFESQRNRPDDLKNKDDSNPYGSDPLIKAQLKHAGKSVQESQMPVEKIAEAVFDSMRNDNFYILTHEKFTGAVAIRMKDILTEGRNPTNLFTPDILKK